jgi:hypothetical protein
MQVTETKIIANRLNGRKSHGPQNTTSTRFNATKHGLLSVGITELDDADGFRTTLRDLLKEMNPVGSIEKFFVESIAVDMVRLKRARRLEADYVTDVLNPPIYQQGVSCAPTRTLLDPGLPALMKLESVQPLVSVYQRYEGTLFQRLLRKLQELERLQRMRQGEILPAPATLDISIRQETEAESVTTMSLTQENALKQEEALSQNESLSHTEIPRHEESAVESVVGSFSRREDSGDTRDLISPRE